MSDPDNSADELNKQEAEHPPVEPVTTPENDPFAGGVENTGTPGGQPDTPPPAPEPDAQAHLLHMFEMVASGFAHLAAVTPAHTILGNFANEIRAGIEKVRELAEGK